ncbi:hypothetical protein TRVA0_013S00320 [Trichomonascus vanleenenianus]|uniref:Jjj1p n=1 Tax=Trichomonascus vanleenenianus TaxID=2268995 RepID=UPI003ECA6296
MGAQQSTPVPAAAAESLYEILGVEKNASDTELKKAYKKQALLLHPDRNYANEEEATKQFAKVQAAFDVLSDPQERAWYDSHGSTGGPGPQEYGGKVTATEELKQYFDPAWYQQLSGNPEEFYRKVGQLFDQLRQEEEEAALDADIQPPLLPRFGDESSQFQRDVRPFYDTWGSFASVKSFAWEDVYRAWDAPDRRTRRAAEQRNKKVREAARKEFNSTVRQLVNAVKAKDPRIKQNNKQKRAKPADAASKAQAKRDREAQAARMKSYEEQDWAKVDDSGVHEAFAPAEEEDEDEPLNLFECIVCDKVFKTKKQLTSHEASKKHVKAVAELKREMRREGVELGFDSDLGGESDNEEPTNNRRKKPEPVEAFPKAPPMHGDEENGITIETQEEEEPKAPRKIKKGGANIIIESDYEESSESDDGGTPSTREPMSSDATLDELLAQLDGTRISNKNREEVKVKGKAKQRRQKKAKQVNEFALKCSVCQTEFPSRNKLFDHVKASGHAAPVPKKK